MIRFTVNGIEHPIPRSLAGDTFGDLMDHVNEEMVTDRMLVCALKVNGVELNETEERALYLCDLDEIRTLEITLSHPVLLAEDTLRTLMTYGGGLADLSGRIADELEQALENGVENTARVANHDFRKLVDGLSTFSESIASVNQVILGHTLPECAALEQEMLGILQSVLVSQEKGELAMLIPLLRERLPDNLDRWIHLGIPALLRAANEQAPVQRASVTAVDFAGKKRADSPTDSASRES